MSFDPAKELKELEEEEKRLNADLEAAKKDNNQSGEHFIHRRLIVNQQGQTECMRLVGCVAGLNAASDELLSAVASIYGEVCPLTGAEMQYCWAAYIFPTMIGERAFKKEFNHLEEEDIETPKNVLFLHKIFTYLIYDADLAFESTDTDGYYRVFVANSDVVPSQVSGKTVKLAADPKILAWLLKRAKRKKKQRDAEKKEKSHDDNDGSCGRGRDGTVRHRMHFDPAMELKELKEEEKRLKVELEAAKKDNNQSGEHFIHRRLIANQNAQFKLFEMVYKRQKHSSSELLSAVASIYGEVCPLTGAEMQYCWAAAIFPNMFGCMIKKEFNHLEEEDVDTPKNVLFLHEIFTYLIYDADLAFESTDTDGYYRVFVANSDVVPSQVSGKTVKLAADPKILAWLLKRAKRKKRERDAEKRARWEKRERDAEKRARWEKQEPNDGTDDGRSSCGGGKGHGASGAGGGKKGMKRPRETKAAESLTLLNLAVHDALSPWH